MMVGLTHRFSPKVSLSLSQTAGMFSRNLTIAGLPQSVPFDPATTFIPTTDYFDNRTFHFGSMADLIYRRTARWSFDFGGGTYGAYRRSKALASPVVAIARADAQYRLSRRVSVGGNYSFHKYTYRRGLGDATIHMAGPSLSMRVNRWLELSGMIGAARMEVKSVQNAPVDPVIAVLLGITSTRQIVHQIEYLKVPTFMVRASRGFRTGVAYAFAGHSLTPGNGLFQTSKVYSVAAGYTYTGLRRWSVNTHVMHNRAEAVGTLSGKYQTTTGNVAIARRLFGSMHLNLGASARQYASETYGGYNRRVYSATVGMSWSPGLTSLRLW
jgi:hypothetical protein